MYDRIASNVRKTWALMLAFIALVALVGWVFGEFTGIGWWGLAGALLLALVMTWGSYLASDRIALSMSKAVPADESAHRDLHNIVAGLSIAAGTPKPRVYVVDDPAPNAFATGRDPEHAAVAVTTGLLDRLTRDELEGVMAHELSHVTNRDTMVMTIAVTLVGVIVLLADWMMRALWWGGGSGRRRGGAGAPVALLGLVLMVVAPLVARLLQFAISRRREFLADADGVFLTRHPQGLIGALEKLRADRTVVRTASKATAHLWIESPIARHADAEQTTRPGAWLNRLFDTHPPLDERIAALREITFGAAPSPPPPPA